MPTSKFTSEEIDLTGDQPLIRNFNGWWVPQQQQQEVDAAESGPSPDIELIGNTIFN